MDFIKQSQNKKYGKDTQKKTIVSHTSYFTPVETIIQQYNTL